MRLRIHHLPWLLFLSATASAQPANPYALTKPGAYSEYKVLPKGKYRDEIVENIALPGGRKGFHSRYDGPRDKADCIYEITPQGDLLRLKVITLYYQLRLSPPVLALPNLDRTKKWSSTSRCTSLAPDTPKATNWMRRFKPGECLHAHPLPAASAADRTKSKAWFAETQGVDGRPRGIHADHIQPYEGLRAHFSQRLC